MKLKSFDHLNCSLAQALSIIGEHWSMLIIRDVFFGLRRFDPGRPFVVRAARRIARPADDGLDARPPPPAIRAFG